MNNSASAVAGYLRPLGCVGTWYAIAVAIYVSCAAVAFAQTLVLNGIPSSAVSSGASETSRHVLGQEKALAA